MNRLQAQYQRLYLPSTAPAPGAATAHPSKPEQISEDTVRALVLALRNPADWDTLAPIWRGVQADLAWPAPAIAVNGVDAFELWFSLAQPVPHVEAIAVLNHLCQRYLPNVKHERLPRWPSLNAAALLAPEAGRIPALHPDTGRWSAFVAPDLPAVFGNDPSLDFPPNEDAQAELLSRLGCINQDDWQAVVATMQPVREVAPVAPAVAEAASVAPTLRSVVASAMETARAASPHHAELVGPYDDPHQFLRDVMNDSSVPLALRLDAAKALLR
ncbi:MAG: hypothetical protein U1D25_12990 [Hydrogenophaga sp.]|uniref:hypothetical protein n=1 Tax=Hydrogenophaga sp. TaxID=1904254 RepID=UPI002769E6B6|nr:hypothetical protein [Hydrogenophaga sp.]MDP2417839.1 hypothetical protein [Hydrogenophaga sp.]MDZ4189007.1 hypothetical protein [Hydrogenophaga sp.]